MKTLKIFALLFVIAFISQSCRKDSDDLIEIPPYIEPEIVVTGSIIGTVLDQNGMAIKDATVTFEDKITFTDEFGVFQFKDEHLYSSGTFIKVTKDGFFDGSRRFYASSGVTSIVTIELIPLQEVAEFNNSEGSQFTFENVALDFEPNSIVNEDGSAFVGNVNVAAKYLDPTLINTLNQMPGDLTGTTTDQNRVSLTSMAMITVELIDDAGNKLQVQEGKTVDAKIPVPQSLQGNAPSTIPMWHFNEEVGTWIEEGSAALVNGFYETSLPHFTFWNCDVPRDFIFLKGSLTNRGVPIQGANVIVTESSGGTSASTLTDENGFFCGYVPNGIDLTLEIFDHCGILIYTLVIPASEEDIFLDPINLFVESTVATLSGSVALCNGTPSPYTYVIARQGNIQNIIAVNEDFTFESNIFYCNVESEILIEAVDPINTLVSGTSSYTVSGDIDVGEIELCDEQITPIFILNYGAVTDTWILYDEHNSPNPSDVNTNYSVQLVENGMQNGEILYKELYTIVTIDTDAGLINDSYVAFVEGQPMQESKIHVGLSGFEANGISSTKKVSQDGKTYLIATGILSNITETTPAWFDPSYVELDYYLAIELE